MLIYLINYSREFETGFQRPPSENITVEFMYTSALPVLWEIDGSPGNLP